MIRPTVRLFTEAGSAVGLGHLARCVALYDAFEDLGCVCELVVSGEAAPRVVDDRHVRVEDWRDPSLLAGFLQDTDIAVVDSYQADADLRAQVAAAVPEVVYLDDTARLAYPAGFVVNGNPSAGALEWPLAMQARPLLGVTYQLLRTPFAQPTARATHRVISRILVMSGGTDAAGALSTFEGLVSRQFPDAEIDVVSGVRSAEEMLSAMLEADIALTAAGQTLYELAATGTPAVVVTVADNQEAQARAFADAGAMALAGRWGEARTTREVGRLLDVLRNPGVRDEMSVTARRLVDGRGSQRVARAVLDELDRATGWFR